MFFALLASSLFGLDIVDICFGTIGGPDNASSF